MAIGRSFAEALQKAQRSLESSTGPFDFGPTLTVGQEQPEIAAELLDRCRTPHDGRLNTMLQALRAGATRRGGGRRRPASTRGSSTSWSGSTSCAETIAAAPELDPSLLREAKANGFSDVADRASFAGLEPRANSRAQARAGDARGLPVVDTCAAEFAAAHPVPLLELRRGQRGAGRRRAQGGHPRRRAEPHRPGHRVRLRCVHACSPCARWVSRP